MLGAENEADDVREDRSCALTMSDVGISVGYDTST